MSNAKAENAKKYKLLGINDDESSCGCCGRKNLKKVVWLEDCNSGEAYHFGTTCAAKLLKITMPEYKELVSDFVTKKKEEYSEKIWPIRKEICELEKLAPENDFKNPETLKSRLEYFRNIIRPLENEIKALKRAFEKETGVYYCDY